MVQASAWESPSALETPWNLQPPGRTQTARKRAQGNGKPRRPAGEKRDASQLGATQRGLTVVNGRRYNQPARKTGSGFPRCVPLV